MTQLTLGAGEAQTIITPPRMRVWIDGRLRRDLKVRQWQWLPAPRFAQIQTLPGPARRNRNRPAQAIREHLYS